MTESNNSSNNVILFLAGCLSVYVLYQKYLYPKIIRIDWMKISKWVIICIVLFCMISFIIYTIYKVRKEEKNKREQIEYIAKRKRDCVYELIKADFEKCNSDEIEEQFEKINEQIKKLDKKLQEECKKEIKEFNRNTAKLYEEKRNKEKEYYETERNKILKEQEKQNIIDKELKELFEFKKAKNSIKALPLDKTYSQNIVRDAEEKMENYLFDKGRLKRIRNEAIEYYQSNDINTKPRIHSDEEPIYTKVREEIKEGKLNIHKPVFNEEISDSEPKIQGNFYRAKDLDEEGKKRAIRQDFKHVRGIELNGLLTGGGFYIKKDSGESDYHFCMKNLFKELSNKMKIEYCLEGKRADVAYISNNLRLGIEIETNKNKDSQLATKIPWLNKNFDKWIFVCSRDALQRYEKHVDNNKSFCFTTKKAKEKVLELIQLSCNYKQ